MTTKKQVDEVYSRPIDPAKPFERLSMLMDYAIGQLKETKEKKVQESASELHSALSCFYPESEVQANKRLSDALEIVLDDLFEKSFEVVVNDPLYIPKIRID